MTILKLTTNMIKGFAALAFFFAVVRQTHAQIVPSSSTAVPTPTQDLSQPVATPTIPSVVVRAPVKNGLIVYSAYRNGNWSLYATSPFKLLTDDYVVGHDEGSPTWSPDGRFITFIANGQESRGAIYVMNADGSHQTLVKDRNAVMRDLKWSPSGDQLLFASSPNGQWDLYVINKDGSGEMQITSDPSDDYDPTWLPDGRIIFASGRSGNAHLYVINRDGTGLIQLTDSPNHEYSPAVSPDGRQILFVLQDASDSQQMDLYTINVDGSQLTRITRRSMEYTDPTWSPDGQEIAVVRPKSDAPFDELVTIDLKDNTINSFDEIVADPAWQPLPR